MGLAGMLFTGVKMLGRLCKCSKKVCPGSTLRGWVRYSDEFCFRVDAKDKGTFDLWSYEKLAEHGLA